MSWCCAQILKSVRSSRRRISRFGFGFLILQFAGLRVAVLANPNGWPTRATPNAGWLPIQVSEMAANKPSHWLLPQASAAEVRGMPTGGRGESKQDDKDNLTLIASRGGDCGMSFEASSLYIGC